MYARRASLLDLLCLFAIIAVLLIEGPATVSTYQKILASVTFDITDEEPDLTERVVCFVVFDRDEDGDEEFESNTVCSRLTIVPRNDHAPQLNVTASGEVFLEESGPFLLLSNVSIVDPDHPQVFPMQRAKVCFVLVRYTVWKTPLQGLV